MMDTEELLRKINDFCDKRSETVNTIEKDHIVKKVIESVNEVVKKGHKTPEEMKTIMDSFLTDSNLNNYLSDAQSFYQKFVKTSEESFATKNKQNFWKGVVSNIFASFLYSVIVAVIIWLGRDQLGNFIASFFK